MAKIKKRTKKKGVINFVQKNVTITKRHEEWINENYVNLSRFLQGKLDEVMAK